MPLLKDFLGYLLICMITLMIPLSIHFFAFLKLYHQGAMSVGMLALAILIYLGRNKFGSWMEYIVVGYFIAGIVLVIFNLGQVLLSLGVCESFYCGYAFALLHRMLGYRVVKFPLMLVFHVLSLGFRLYILYDHTYPVSIMITAVEISTMCLTIKSEKGERDLFDSLYKSKQQLLKFKDFITDHLPHQMAIFSKDYSETHLINKAFKECFQCDDIYQTKCSLKALIIEKEAINKNMALFARLGYIPDTKTQPLSLSQFMWLLSKNIDLIRGSEVLSFQVCEDENIAQGACTISHQSGDSSDDDNVFSPKHNNSKKTNTKVKRRLQKAGSLIGAEISTPNDKFSSFTERLVKKDPFEAGDKDEFEMEENVEDKNNNSHEDGKGRIFKVKIFLLHWDGEETVGIMLDDITQQRTFMELKMSNKNKDLVVAMASHELRTPLKGMLGLIDIAKKNIVDQNVMLYLDACKNNGMFLLNLVNSMLDLSQIRAKKLRLSYSKVNVREMLNEISSLFKSFSLTKKIYLRLDIANDVPEMINTDRSRLIQILINLVENAFKYTSEGGITVKAELERQTPCKIKFTVQDTGVGIPREDLGKLFKLFGKLEHQDQKVNCNGVGLGLTISNNLAILLNPFENRGIYVDSEHGKGTTFSFGVQSRDSKDVKSEKNIQGMSIKDIDPLLNDDENQGELPLESKAAPYVGNNSKNLFKARSFQQGQKNFSSKLGIKKAGSDCRDLVALMKNTEEGVARSDSSGPCCLIVDDNPFNLMVGRYIMEEKGYWIKTALNGKEATEKIVEHEKCGKKFDVILMDCQMPVMDGFAVTKALKKMMKNGDIAECPIVALTANKEDVDQEKKCREAGMIGCITKPLQMVELEEVLQKIQK